MWAAHRMCMCSMCMHTSHAHRTHANNTHTHPPPLHPPLTRSAQENILTDAPSEPVQHPMVDEMFEGFDLERGRFVPNAQLRVQYPAPTPE